MKRVFTSLLIAFGLMGTVVLSSSPTVAAVDVWGGCGASSDTAVCKAANDDKILGSGGLLHRIINIMLTIVGIVAVIMIIIGGLRYVLSNGDSNAVNGAKNTILYSVIGLVVAIMAYAIVNFVLGNL